MKILIILLFYFKLRMNARFTYQVNLVNKLTFNGTIYNIISDRRFVVINIQHDESIFFFRIRTILHSSLNLPAYR